MKIRNETIEKWKDHYEYSIKKTIHIISFLKQVVYFKFAYAKDDRDSFQQPENGAPGTVEK